MSGGQVPQKGRGLGHDFGVIFDQFFSRFFVTHHQEEHSVNSDTITGIVYIVIGVLLFAWSFRVGRGPKR